jgi:serpin B
VNASMMYQRSWFAYLQTPGYQAIELPYRGEDLSMVVFLPDRKDGLPDLEKTLSSALIDECLAQMQVCQVDLFVPRFKVTWGTVDLLEQLTALEMRLAFDPSRADFSGINGRRPPDPRALFFSAVYHQAFVDANEEGTEAAAAAAVTVTLGGLVYERIEVPVFRADHPFVFAIRERASGAILFLGRVADPTSAA